MRTALTHLADRTYRLLLAALPSDVRRECSNDMVQLFRDQRRHTGGRPWALVALWIAAASDVFTEAIASRRPRVAAQSLEFASMKSIFADVRYAFRLLVRHRGFTAAAGLVLALGTGATTTVLSLTDSLLLRPRTGRPAGEIVGLYTRDRTHPDAYRAFSYPDYAELRARTDIFASLTAHNLTLAGLTEGNSTRRVLADVATANFFDTFGAPVALGRTFTAEEERPDANIFVTVLSDGMWRRLGARADFVGQTVRLSGRTFTVVGVAAPGFGGSLGFVTPELWLPTGVYDSITEDMMRGGTGTSLGDRQRYSLIVLAQLKPGATIASVAPALQAASLERARASGENRDQELLAAPLSRFSISTRPTTDREIAGVIAMLMAMATIVLVIASFNLANMLLARGGARRKEFAIRLAIGGSRARLARQLVIEGFVLSLVGGAAGLLVAVLAVRWLLAVLTPVTPVMFMIDASPDLRTLAAALASCVAATLVFATLPALKLARTDAVPELKEQAGDIGGRRGRMSISNLLVTAQLAFSLVMLTLAAIAFRGAVESASADPGFSFDRGILVQMDTNMAGHDEARSRDIYRRVLDRVRARPEVASASLASIMPFGDMTDSQSVQKAGAEIDPNDARAATGLVTATFTSITHDYFSSVGLRLLAGRDFTASEELVEHGPNVAIIDEPLARKLFGADNPIGQAIQLNDGTHAHPPQVVEVVGVAPGVRDDLFADGPEPHLYVPYGQTFRTNAFLHVRTSSTGADEGALLPGLRRDIASTDAALPILAARTLSDWRTHNDLFLLVRMFAAILGTFGAAALVLATVGLYGLTAYVVSRRTREIGIRIALGATPSGVTWLVVREGWLWSAIGLIVGAALSVAAAFGMRSMIYQGRGADPLILALVVGALTSTGFLASWLPARRASHIAPIQAMRNT
jgi:predicted permease